MESKRLEDKMESRSMLTGDELPMAGDGCLMFSFERVDSSNKCNCR
jgi:hypothetical protein